MDQNPYITTREAGRRLGGISAIRVTQLIAEGRLPARKVGRDWLIDERDLPLVADRKPGRRVERSPDGSRPA